MPSERRLHPATLLFELAQHVKRFALPSLLVVLGMSTSSGGPGGRFGNLPDGWEAWLVVLFVPATAASIVRYLTFRLRYEEHELVIRSGLLFRNERHIPFSRIQNVDAIQNPFHRMLGVVEVRVETGGGEKEEARLSVLPQAALTELRDRVFGERSRQVERIEDAAVRGETLLHLSLREVVLCGFLENKGMVLVGAAAGLGWQSGLMERLTGMAFAGRGSVGRGFFRDLGLAVFDGGPMPVGRIAILVLGFVLFLLLVRLLSMAWAFLRLYDFRLTRVGEDLRTEYGLLTKVSATVPLRRIQAITIAAGPLHRLLKRATVRVATAGGGAAGSERGANTREWLAPLIAEPSLPRLLQHLVPGFDLASVTWQPLHPRAFARAVKPPLIASVIVSIGAAILAWWLAMVVLAGMLIWSIAATRQHVAHLGWAEGDEVVMLRSGWLWRQITLARVNKIQAVAMHQSPFDRRAAMARVRVDTAGGGALSHRVDIPYLDHQVAAGLANRLSASAASTAFRW
jgi:putative membrane protein